MSTFSMSGISGIDSGKIIEALMSIQKKPIDDLNKEKSALGKKLSLFQEIGTKLSSLKSTVSSLRRAANFSVKSTTSTDTTKATASASSSASKGTYALNVTQLAQAHKLGSQGVAALTSTVGTGSGNVSIKVGSGNTVNVAVTASTTIQDLRDAINNAGAGVSASIINDGSPTNPYRLVVTSSTSGLSNNIQLTNFNTLTNLEFSSKSIESSYAYTTNSYAGTATSGGTYTGSDNSSYIVKITGGGAIGAATYQYSTDGGVSYNGSDLTVAASNTIANGVTLGFTAGTFAVDDKFSVDVFNPTIQSQKDAVFKLDNLSFSKSSNTVSDVISGVTLNLLKADSTGATNINIGISNDTEATTKKVNDFVSAYNAVLSYINEQTKYDPATKSGGPLISDSTARSIQKRVQSIISNTITGLSGTYKSLSEIGIKSEKDGTLSVDSKKLSTALTTDFDSVVSVFVRTGTTTDSTISFVSNSKNSVAGTYTVNITQDPTKGKIVGGSAITFPTTIDSTNNTLSLTVDGTASGSITLTSGTYTTASSLATEVENKINADTALSANSRSVSVSSSGNILTITSNNYGSSSAVSISSSTNDAAATLKIDSGSSPVSTVGVDVAGSYISGVSTYTATGSGNLLTGDAGFNTEGLKVAVISTTTGNHGTISLSLGIAEQIYNETNYLTDSLSGPVKIRQDGIDRSVASIKKRITRKESDLATEEERLKSKYAKLDSLMSSLQSQANLFR